MKFAQLFLVLAGLGLIVTGQWEGSLLAQTSSLSGKIAYNCGGDICLLNLTTGEEIQLTSTVGKSEYNPKLSPDGAKIVFQSTAGINLMNVDGTGRIVISNFGGLPAWSPDGTKITFAYNGIWVMNADGSGKTQLTIHGSWPAWSPDGSQIAFSSTFDNGGEWDLWVMNPDGTNGRRVCPRPGAEIDVVWLPGPKIAFGGFTDQKNSYEIFACDPNTDQVTRLTTSRKQDFEPAWSPDGTMIAFASLRTPAGIYVMNENGSSLRMVISGGRQPSWGP